MNQFPASEEVDRIAQHGDAILRNLLITQCYHALALAIATRTGPYANWCTFATWASKQAGQTIRKEDLARTLEPTLRAAPATADAAAAVMSAAQRFGARLDAAAVHARLWEVVDPYSAIERSSAAVARGNQKVFAEIGREFARFAAACLVDPAFDADRIARFCDGLRDGEPPHGQRYLRQAFTRYYRAFFEQEPKTRAELMLLANLEIGLHEQTRLQPEIAEALDASLPPSDQLAGALLDVLFPRTSWLIRAAVLAMRSLGRPLLLDRAVTRLGVVAHQQVRLLLTEHLMTLTLPHGVRLRLGDDLNAEFPAALRQLASPELLALLAQIDPSPNSLRETGAVDWADLRERLHFIADLFRCYEETPELWEPPFAPEQVEALKAERVPAGVL